MSVNRIVLLFFISLWGCKIITHDEKGKVPTSVRSSMAEGALTTQEAELLNSLLEGVRGTFDFEGKRIAFISGSMGKRVLSKDDYFENYVTPWLSEGKVPYIAMTILTKEEKNISGGYDALVLSWVKYFSARQKRRIIQQLAPTN
ncbi:MAG: hypothetical protein KF905_10615 [Flavobacteriales bacterium]|nr:hypothetical protein [Flavobacteriales bacterium]